jgi:hypothetical protein
MLTGSHSTEKTPRAGKPSCVKYSSIHACHAFIANKADDQQIKVLEDPSEFVCTPVNVREDDMVTSCMAIGPLIEATGHTM